MATFLTLDLETRSAANLKAVGAFRYAQDPTTDVLCCSYAFDNGPIQRWRPGEDLPQEIVEHVAAGGLIRAWNVTFEWNLWVRVLHATYGWPKPTLGQWVCSAALAARVGLPRKLEEAAKVLGLPEQKDTEGYRVMMRLSQPKRTKQGGGFWTREEDPKAFAILEDYCDQDVRTERAVFKALPRAGSETERSIFLHDLKINARGVPIDLDFVHRLRELALHETHRIDQEIQTVTDGFVQAVTQVAPMKVWLDKTQGLPVSSLDKNAIRDLLAGPDLSPDARRLLELRAEGSKSSIAKLTKILETVNPLTGRIEGMLRYYGAGTGRWAGQLVQPQNFPKGHPDLTVTEDLIEAAALGDGDLLDTLTPEGVTRLDVCSSLLRGCFCAPRGRAFSVADFSQIEARINAWVAGAEVMLQAFRDRRSPYLEMGQTIYHRPISKADAFEYFIAKQTVLGCGFQMGKDKFRDKMLEDTGILLTEEMVASAVEGFRTLYWQIPRYWKALQRTVVLVVSQGVTSWTAVPHTRGRIAMRIRAHSGRPWLEMSLPSGRSLWYPLPKMSIRPAPWTDEATGKPAMLPCVTVAGVNSQTRQWQRYALYGGLLSENIAQATARDVMAAAMHRVEAAGYPVILTVHDEILTEHAEGFGSLAEFETLMATPPAWAAGCPITAEGWRGKRFRK